jgi:hypothetical protein
VQHWPANKLLVLWDRAEDEMFSLDGRMYISYLPFSYEFIESVSRAASACGANA